MKKDYIEIYPYKDYGWLDLPKNSKVTKLRFNGHHIELHYKSSYNQIYFSDGNLGFEYYTFRKNEDVQVKVKCSEENREIVYSGIVNCNGENILIIILKWVKL